MTQFLYFFPLPMRATVDRQTVAESFAVTALRDLLRSDQIWNTSVIFNKCVIDGPGAQQGVVFAVKAAYPDGFMPAFVKDRQTWIKIDDAWLGWFDDMPPTEESLRKPSVIQGYPVQLNDDQFWTAPTIYCHPRNSRRTLPQAIRLGDSGQRILGVKEFYQRWQDLAECVWNHIFGIEAMTTPALLDAAGEMLSLNYRIGPKEIDALGLFDMVPDGCEDKSNWSDILSASCDLPLVREFLEAEDIKKKEQAPEPSKPSPGNEVAASEAAV